MAQKRDLAAEKARKQKIILAVAGAALVALAAFQVPKLMGGDGAPAAAPAAAPPAATTPAGTTPPATGTDASGTAGVASPTTAKPVIYVAGVGLPGTKAPAPATSQLASFTLFEATDPFVQQVDDAVPAGETQAPEAKPAPSAPAAGAAGGPPAVDVSSPDTGVTGGQSVAEPKAPPVKYATVNFEGKPQQLEVKGTFPKGNPMFVLVAVKKKLAKIGVAGGSFDDGATITLQLGKKVTLVNTATEVRYELKLVYTGSEPEVIEGFTPADAAKPAAVAGGSTVSAIPEATP